MLYMKNNFKFPIIPCKNRCIKDKDSELFCDRDKGFILGISVSLIIVYIIKQYDLLKFIDINQYYLLIMGFF